MQKRLVGIRKAQPEVTADAVKAEFEIEVQAIIPMTPLRTGALRDSIRVEGPEMRGTSIWCAIAAGGPEAPYAVYVHEDPDAYHPVGEYRFMAKRLEQSGPHMAARVAKRANCREFARAAGV
jgi:hypothetical protein